jgi:hypothetical protein
MHRFYVRLLVNVRKKDMYGGRFHAMIQKDKNGVALLMPPTSPTTSKL